MCVTYNVLLPTPAVSKGGFLLTKTMHVPQLVHGDYCNYDNKGKPNNKQVAIVDQTMDFQETLT